MMEIFTNDNPIGSIIIIIAGLIIIAFLSRRIRRHQRYQESDLFRYPDEKSSDISYENNDRRSPVDKLNDGV